MPDLQILSWASVRRGTARDQVIVEFHFSPSGDATVSMTEEQAHAFATAFDDLTPRRHTA